MEAAAAQEGFDCGEVKAAAQEGFDSCEVKAALAAQDEFDCCKDGFGCYEVELGGSSNTIAREI